MAKCALEPRGAAPRALGTGSGTDCQLLKSLHWLSGFRYSSKLSSSHGLQTPNSFSLGDANLLRSITVIHDHSDFFPSCQALWTPWKRNSRTTKRATVFRLKNHYSF